MTFKKRYILLLLLFLILMNTGVYAQTTITGATGTFPTAASLDADANIYVAQYDQGSDHYDVVRYTAASSYSSSTVIYNGLYYDGEYPTDIEVASNGDVYVLDGIDEPASTGAILRLDASNDYISSTVPLLGSYPTALGIDANDDIYVAEYDGVSDYQVVKYDESAEYSSKVLYNGLGLTGRYPTGLTVDPDGNVYALTEFNVDEANGKIIKLTAPGYGSSTLDQGDYYTGMAANGIGDVFAAAYNSGADNYQIVKYTGGSGTPSSVVTGLTYSGSSYPIGLGSNLALGDLVIPDPWASGKGRLLYLDQSDPVTNNPPTDIALSSTSINQSATGAGAVVGGLSTIDADGGDIHNYSLVNNGISGSGSCGASGDDNNASFQIDNTNEDLETAVSLSVGSYNVCVQTDDGTDTYQKSFTITVNATAPTVTTTTVSTFGATSATLGGNVTDDGGASVDERGIVWATTPTPDITDNKVGIGIGTGAFSQSVGLLPFGTTIYVRAYATNSEGTAYGTDQSFTTSGTVTRNLTGVEGWRLLSVPAGVNLSTFLGPIWTQGVTSGGDTDFGTPNVYTWSTAIDGNSQADWQAVTDLTNTTLAGGQGLLVQVYADPDYDGITSPGFPQTLSVTGSEFASGTSPTMNSNANGWTLLGNPFASAIDYDNLSKSNLAFPIYGWDPNYNAGDGGQGGQSSGSWKTYNGSSGDLTDGRIAPFQGFLVQNNGSVGSVTFSQSSKTSTATTFLGKENPTPFVRLELQGQGMSNSAWLEFSSEGSLEKTDGDAWELTPLSSNYALLATRKADGSLVDIGRFPQSAELEIPLITEATQSGTYVLNVTDFEATGQNLYLNDLHTGESIRMEEDTRYEFTIEKAAKAPADPFAILQDGLKKQADSGHRFVISSSAPESPVETPEQFTLEQNYPNPFNPVTVINYQLPVSSQVRLELFDMSGRQIATLVNTQQNAGIYSVNFDGSDLSSGVYMYRLQAGNQIFTKKLTLIK